MPRRKATQTGKSPFSLRMQSLRKDCKLNMEQLAQAVGVSKSFISLLESGGRQPSREVVLNLSQALSNDADTEKVRDELLILAGFMPINPKAVQAYQNTLQVYASAVEKNPENFQLFSRWVMALIRSEKQDEAQQRIKEGLQRFQNTAHIYCLRSHLELSKNNYLKALDFQQQAVDEAEKSKALKKTTAFADLKFNLGAIYFLLGHQAMRESDKTQALTHFSAALEILESILPLADAYILDEYARLLFNQAYLTQKKAHWEQTIQAYRHVLIHPEKAKLGVIALKESAAFLAHAYTQKLDFDTAELTLGLLSAFQSEDWLVNYLQACLYTAMSQHKKKPEFLERAMISLKQSFDISPARVRQEALNDPDLDLLRQQKKKDFYALFEEKKS